MSAAMPYLSRVIKPCTYNPSANILVFRMEGKSALIYPKAILVYPVEDEAEARLVLDWLRDIIDAADEG